MSATSKGLPCKGMSLAIQECVLSVVPPTESASTRPSQPRYTIESLGLWYWRHLSIRAAKYGTHSVTICLIRTLMVDMFV
jgi:hypothetical protein